MFIKGWFISKKTVDQQDTIEKFSCELFKVLEKDIN